MSCQGETILESFVKASRKLSVWASPMICVPKASVATAWSSWAPKTRLFRDAARAVHAVAARDKNNKERAVLANFMVNSKKATGLLYKEIENVEVPYQCENGAYSGPDTCTSSRSFAAASLTFSMHK
jgi:hypothetical protein